MDNSFVGRGKRIKFLALDVDGVLTHGYLFIGADGEKFKRFNCLDGLGISIAKRNGLQVAVITGRTGDAVLARARELGIDMVRVGVKDKGVALREFAAEVGVELEEVAYMGDDLNDLPALQLAGLALAPANACQDVSERVHYMTKRAGGEGAVREAIEFIFKAQGRWDDIVAPYLTEGQGDKQ